MTLYSRLKNEQNFNEINEQFCKILDPFCCRSPSPEPIYNNEGKRLNTREFRTRKKLEDKRHESIQTMFSLNPGYKPPADYKLVRN